MKPLLPHLLVTALALAPAMAAPLPPAPDIERDVTVVRPQPPGAPAAPEAEPPLLLAQLAPPEMTAAIEAQIAQLESQLVFLGEDMDAGTRPAADLWLSRAWDDAARQELAEDLHILQRILEKGVPGAPDKPRVQAMGIPVHVDWNRADRPVYLDGFGAVFRLTVDFPLLAPAEPEPEPTPRETNSAWEETRKELYGGRGPRPPQPPPVARRYDAAQVEALQDGLLEALRQGVNLRHLAPEDRILVVVRHTGRRRGPGPVELEWNSDRIRYGLDPGVVTIDEFVRTSRSTGGQTLTIRVRRADLDDVGPGESGRQTLRERAEIQIY